MEFEQSQTQKHARQETCIPPQVEKCESVKKQQENRILTLYQREENGKESEKNQDGDDESVTPWQIRSYQHRDHKEHGKIERIPNKERGGVGEACEWREQHRFEWSMVIREWPLTNCYIGREAAL